MRATFSWVWSVLSLLLLVLGGCVVPPQEVADTPHRPTNTEDPPVDEGDTPAPADEPEDEGEDAPVVDPPDDTQAPEPDPSDPIEPTAPGALCFPGPDDADDVCVDVVPYDAASFGSAYAYPSSSDARYQAPIRYIDLTLWDTDIPIAQNFVLGELVGVEKGRWAVLQPHFVRSLQRVRDAVGGPVSVNSGYRNPSWNAGVGGVEFSRHQWGDAADIASNGVALEDLGAICEDMGAAYVGYYAAHVHCDWRDDTLDPVLFGIAAGGASLAPPEHDASLVPGAPGAPWTAPASGWEEGEPLRAWTARDADGEVISTHTGSTFTPPDEAATVEVRVGGEIELRSR